MPEIQAEMPKDLRLKWGVSPFEYDPKAQTFELYAINLPNVTDALRWKVT
mgnify:CR=1 FL=1